MFRLRKGNSSGTSQDLLEETNHGLPGLGQEDREEGLIFSKQQDILEAFEIRFQRVPEGLREEIEAISDSNKLIPMFVS